LISLNPIEDRFQYFPMCSLGWHNCCPYHVRARWGWGNIPWLRKGIYILTPSCWVLRNYVFLEVVSKFPLGLLSLESSFLLGQIKRFPCIYCNLICDKIHERDDTKCFVSQYPKDAQRTAANVLD
jgi:hypothetical protein